MSFEEQYFDVLKAIETTIVEVYGRYPQAKDRHVENALKGLVRFYNAALKNKRPPRLKLNEVEQAFYDNLKAMAEVQMMGGQAHPTEHTYTMDEIVLCLKRIQRSVGQMMKAGGLSGSQYLEFVRDYQKKQE